MCSFAGAAEAAPPQVLSPTTSHYGQTYKQWAATWQQWAHSTPVRVPAFTGPVNHPLVDLTGSKCGVGQSGPVWFLGGAFFEVGTAGSNAIVRDRCVVPRGTALYFPMLNTSCTEIEGTGNGCGASLAHSKVIVDDVIDLVTSTSVDVDRVRLDIPQGARVGSAGPGYCLNLPSDNLLSFLGEGPDGYPSKTPFPAGISCDTADDGYYLMVAPLAAGRHTVHFRGEIASWDNFALDVTYHLRVE
jgi:hypothetical protein